MKLLHLDSSNLGAFSASRILSSEIVERQSVLYPGIRVRYRDLANDPALHLSGAYLAARQGQDIGQPQLATQSDTGNAHVDEVSEADIVVIGTPMHNFSVSPHLKAWIDRILVRGRTFEYSETGKLKALLPPGKSIIVALTRCNNYQSGSPTAAFEHHESYLQDVLSFLGLHNVTFVRVEGLAFGSGSRDVAITRARAEIAAIMA
ncbi:FMN-dependent NADH-azoreductase [Paraburkholderia pallida]|uniref:FMN dependent NADH:quinone oxidoreductase n=1 Tax=Paraburkholderia pallida TaxID=2547399 RepID=A0A4P7D521_9BURK|nr:NAD(P)H-dependent oxidoreductase [Paraburkholderia pallida]QBR01664.1 FMN-dependent NADH-azoreductase [Paraburkholderia pallida]